MSYAHPVVDRRSLVSLSAVIVLHLAALQVLQMGLSHDSTVQLARPIEAALIEDPGIEAKEPPPPPPQLRPLPVDAVPAPEIAIDLPADSNSISLPVAAEQPRVAATAATAALIPPRIDRERSNIIPEYPSTSKRLGESGRVLVAVFILANGRVGDVQVLKSSGYARLDNAALAHVQRDWKFVPARLDGEAIAAWGRFGVTFQIQD